MKSIIIVIDSFGCGEEPDAKLYGDEGSNTLLNINKVYPLMLTNMTKLGIKNIDGIDIKNNEKIIGCYGKMQEKTPAKDTTAGHYEISGIVMEHPYPTFPKAFPKELIDKIENETGYKFLGNEVASGTEIIKRLGDEHLKTKEPIIYTSQDSVLQIACHLSVLPLEKLYSLCEKIRTICVGKYNIGRIIARPFTTINGEYVRTQDRRDYALKPPTKSMLDYFKENNYDVIGVGKIGDIFEMQGITKSYHTLNNHDGLEKTLELSKSDINGLIFVNLVDTDMLYGHRNDILGYKNALENIDSYIDKIENNLKDDDLLIITADHGCDPTTPSTDHSREYVPLLIYGKKIKHNINLHTLYGFDNVSKSLLDYFNIKKYEDSFLRKIKE
jgi:phosphopentomutase